jgi:hypothetical protein
VTNWSSSAELAVRMSRATVVGTGSDGAVLVLCQGDQTRRLLCDVVQTAYLPVLLEPGDTVVILVPDSEEGRGIIFGRIGQGQVAPPEPDPAAEDVPDELIIEAKKNLTLKCGEGSITIRQDGKILIKGKDLVSHAQRMNRIKGGSVAIN